MSLPEQTSVTERGAARALDAQHGKQQLLYHDLLPLTLKNLRPITYSLHHCPLITM
jgi:hypothetical protein